MSKDSNLFAQFHETMYNTHLDSDCLSPLWQKLPALSSCEIIHPALNEALSSFLFTMTTVTPADLKKNPSPAATSN